MRIVLISPKGPLYRHRGGIFKKSLRYAPLTLVTLSALVPDDIQADIQLVDEGIQDVPLDLEADLIGMTVITGSAPRAYELADHFRARGIPVVLGGPHVTLVPDDAAPHADALVVGYAEDTWPALLRDFAAGRMAPRYQQAPDFELSERNLRFPRREMHHKKSYITTAVVEATRGCIHDCDFCVVPSAWGRKPYQKPIEHVVEDVRRTRAKHVIFIDLNLIADPDHAKQLFEALIPLKVHWYGLSTTRITKDRELLDLTERSGCRGLLLGFETLSPANLRSSKKGFNDPDDYKGIVRELHARNVSINGTFVLGLDQDDPSVFQRTAEFVIDAAIDLPRFAVATPFPGTTLFKRLEAEGRILTRDWNLYDGQHVVFQPARMSPAELLEGHTSVWQTVYSRRNIARRIAGSRVQIPLSVAANWGYRFYAHNLHRYYTCDWYVGSEGRAEREAA